MKVLVEAEAPGLIDLRDLTLDGLTTDGEAARILEKLTRSDEQKGAGADPVPVAAFNSFI